MITLGIESSCDETSVALLKGKKILANEIYTQQIHSEYGGVVPEIASRAHLQKIDILTATVLKRHDLTLHDIDQIAVTDGPGLAGALLVGISFALGIHKGYNKPVCGIHHLEGHIQAVFFENDELSYPFIALVVSGGHTSLYAVEKFGRYECLGRTIDDAAGEAFDKVGKLIGFNYPAGRSIEEEAQRFEGKTDIHFPVAKVSHGDCYFSFSGLKTAVRYFLESQPKNWLEKNRPELCFAFQKAVIKSLVKNTRQAIKKTGIRQVACVGGVACNGTLRKALQSAFGKHTFFPSPRLCTDNAAMIARVGYERFKRNMVDYPVMTPNKELL